ncbi:polymer-forming cytoskeletal protein [Chitinophaga nivalis]|uniref:Polymer-forming cytoskeletal protein n=1 Tax=Chitinophaga nivalis TaxID=2991709 RepID=A0ABT3IGH3_9BACT|nr:polymer-forming cytoskeletal protein [Chitinophaga nivalis]MCW3467240.1 polymer-forming cytoskeletal protein [Chitinophaga nivalis]MCW3483068.1 polymer-forming cytoskeletal protein [Chitinophaga nivalis]
MEKKFRLISCKDANAQYHIAALIYESEEMFFDIIADTDYFYIHEGDLALTDHLILDTDTLPDTPDGQRIQGYIVTGNLTVAGSILNETGDYGPALYVAGDVHCRSLLIGGSPVHVTGNITAEEMILLHYNHGWMQCGGTLTAPVFIAEDYHFTPTVPPVTTFYYHDNDPEMPAANHCTEGEEDDDEIAVGLRTLLHNPLTTTFEELRRDLAAGEYVLRATVQDAAYWQRKVKSNWQDLKRVPPEMRTHELCMMALHGYVGALAYFPAALLDASLVAYAVEKDGKALRYLPEEYITRELCYLGAAHGAMLKHDIPEAFYEPELLLLAIRRADHQMEAVPVQWITEDLLVEYVKIGRGAFLDHYCEKAGISKKRVLERVIADGIQFLEPVFGWHLSAITYRYAADLYNNNIFQPEWTAITEKHARKIARLTITE